jgi:hypothetical protein
VFINFILEKPCNDSDSEDALDAFMAGIEKQVETQKNREGIYLYFLL